MMTTRTKAELAARCVGLAIAVSILIPYLTGSHFLFDTWGLLLPVALFVCAGPASRWLFREEGERNRTYRGDLVYVGTKLLGLYMAGQAVLVVLLSVTGVHSGLLEVSRLVPLAGLFVPGAYLLWLPPHLQRVLPRTERPDACGMDSDEVALAAGVLTFLGVYWAVSATRSTVNVLVLWPARPERGTTILDFSTHHVLQLLLAAALLVYVRPVARWLCRGGERGEKPGTGRSAAAVMFTGFTLALAYVVWPFFTWVARNVNTWLSELSSDLAGPVVLFGGVVATIVWVPRVLRGAARWFYPVESDDDLVADARVPVHVGLTLIIIYTGITWLMPRRSPLVLVGPQGMESVVEGPRVIVKSLLLGGLLMLLRGDIAWLLLGRPSPEGRDDGAGRQYWLGMGFPLMGGALLLYSLPHLLATLALYPLRSALVPVVPAACGGALVLFSRPLARWLSYGRVLPQVWEAVWKTGWRRGGDDGN